MWKTQKSFKNTSLALCGLLSASLALSACLQVKATGIKSKLAEEVADEESAVLLDVDFASTTISLPIGSAYDSGAPTVTNGPIVSCAVSPALPTGLSLDTSTCRVTGTPTALSATASYDVIATGAENVVTISVSLEVHDVAPAIAYSSATYNFSMGASSTTGAPTNTGGAIASCSIDHAVPAGLTFNTSSCVISGTPTSVSAADSFAITATNAYGSSAVQTISIQVLNIAPNISFTGSPYVFNLFNASSTTGVPSNTGGAITSCGVAPALPAGLSIDQSSCEISGTPSAVVAAANYTVTPTNGIGSGTGRVISIEVANVVPSIAYSGGTYNFSLNAVSSSGTPTNTGGAITGCSVDVALPTGLSLNTSDCTISGTPTVVTAAANYTITPSNAIGNGSSRVLRIEISDVVPSISYGSATYTFSLNAVSTTGAPSNTGGAIISCASDIALPDGLSIDPTTCEISGTPTVVKAAANYSLRGRNNVGNGNTVVLSIEVVNVVPNIAFGSGSYNFNLNALSSTTPTNTGGEITGCTVDIALPAGLTLNTTNCKIGGTPTAVTAAANYTITPSNAMGNGTARTISIEVSNVVPSIAYSSASYAFDILSAATTGVPENSGGAITGCSVDVALPTGLSLNTSNCTISGTPTTVVADAIYTITPSNAIGSGTSQTLNIKTRNIVPSLGYTGAPYTFTKNSAATGTATNSGGAITGCTSDIALPTGLSLSSTTCSISGTPTVAAAAASYTITPSNEIGSGAARTISITVLDPVTVTAVNDSRIGCDYTGTVTVTGTGFITGATVTYGGMSCGSVSVTSSTSLTCSITSFPGRMRTVTVTNSNGSTFTSGNIMPACVAAP